MSMWSTCELYTSLHFIKPSLVLVTIAGKGHGIANPLKGSQLLYGDIMGGYCHDICTRNPCLAQYSFN